MSCFVQLARNCAKLTYIVPFNQVPWLVHRKSQAVETFLGVTISNRVPWKGYREGTIVAGSEYVRSRAGLKYRGDQYVNARFVK